MNVVKNIFKTNMVKKIIVIVLILILLIIGILYIFSPTTKLLNNLNKINGTYHNLENHNKMITYYNKCKVAVYPTENLVSREYIQDDKYMPIVLYVKTPTTTKFGSIGISVGPIQDENNEAVRNLNELSKIQEPKIAKTKDEFNYFVYNERNYYYMITSSSFTCFTPINNDYLYWVSVSNYKNLTKEDIESILYFEVIN